MPPAAKTRNELWERGVDLAKSVRRQALPETTDTLRKLTTSVHSSDAPIIIATAMKWFRRYEKDTEKDDTPRH